MKENKAQRQLSEDDPPPPPPPCLRFANPACFTTFFSVSRCRPAPIEISQPKRDFAKAAYLPISRHLVNMRLNCSGRGRVSFVVASMRT